MTVRTWLGLGLGFGLGLGLGLGLGFGLGLGLGLAHVRAHHELERERCGEEEEVHEGGVVHEDELGALLTQPVPVARVRHADLRVDQQQEAEPDRRDEHRERVVRALSQQADAVEPGSDVCEEADGEERHDQRQREP
eukprot:scaffold15132_cov57-Phaeocystis_antarctica.AAC.2